MLPDLLLSYIASVPNAAYQLSLCRNKLLCLCITWRLKVAPIPHCNNNSEYWGPSEEELCDTGVYELMASMDQAQLHNQTDLVDTIGSDISEGDLGDRDSNAEQYGDFIDIVEATDLSDAHCKVGEFDFYMDISASDIS